MKSRSLILALAVTLAPGFAVGESVYKWTDENGVTHFGDRQPVGARAESVNVRTGRGSNPQAGEPSPQESVEALEGRQQDEAERQRVAAVEEARQKQRAANCEAANTNLRILNSTSRIRVEEDGEARYLTPAEIEEKRNSFQQIADESCSPETTTQ
ncbi:DUF4124 domain-containing protein [Marinobacter zhejiangensis]|uniref:DUF4124 domain-containing protein n=1 Tax=Marinobacter zhejiangensis TaxID=488535 RepID=A0A1I4S7E9_9GAMM|nr:DUF4124 domain-containing protein [Marinobacter zhejiangensis]SFM60203.1 protein of unknown function [Marinobacter zhejiangensis]